MLGSFAVGHLLCHDRMDSRILGESCSVVNCAGLWIGKLWALILVKLQTSRCIVSDGRSGQFSDNRSYKTSMHSSEMGQLSAAEANVIPVAMATSQLHPGTRGVQRLWTSYTKKTTTPSIPAHGSNLITDIATLIKFCDDGVAPVAARLDDKGVSRVLRKSSGETDDEDENGD